MVEQREATLALSTEKFQKKQDSILRGLTGDVCSAEWTEQTENPWSSEESGKHMAASHSCLSASGAW